MVVVMITMMMGVTNGRPRQFGMSTMVVGGGPGLARILSIRLCSAKPIGTFLHGILDFAGTMLEPDDAPVLMDAEAPGATVDEVTGHDPIPHAENNRLVLLALLALLALLVQTVDGTSQLKLDHIRS